MLKRVGVKIESVIDDLGPSGLPEGESDKSVVNAMGALRINDGVTTLTYSESTEGGEVRSEIICRRGEVTVKRSGAIESELLFIEGQIHRSVYSIPPYKFDAAVKAKRVRVEIGDTEGRIDLIYNMMIGGAEKAARMKIWILQASNQV